jgi:hypothetical protein
VEISDYITWTQTSAVYPEKHSADYLAFGLLDELGELCGLLKREIREGTPRDNDALRAELGDLAWYLARIWPAEEWEARRNSWHRCPGSALPLVEILDDIARSSNLSRCLIYYFDLVSEIGFSLAQVLDANVAKIEARKARGTVMGKGDSR